MRPNTAKSAELQIMAWFLEARWEVFTPLADQNATDLVVRRPSSDELLAIQVKHKEPGARNEGQLYNSWGRTRPPFDYLVFYQVEKCRGVILPRSFFSGRGQTLFFYKLDSDGYSNGPVRKLFQVYAFDLATTPILERGQAFEQVFLSVHASAISKGAA